MINWKLRLKNKATLTTLIVLCIGFVYTVLGIIGIVPSVSQEQIVNVALMLVEILVVLGVIVDPTTAGIKDPSNVMQYEEPRKELDAMDYAENEKEGETNG